MNDKMIKQKWTDDEIKKIIKLYPETKNVDIASELKRSISSIVSMSVKYNLHKTKKFKSELISSRNKIVGRNLTFELLKNIASKYKSRGEFLTKDPSAYTTSRIAGYLPDICQHMSIVGFSIPQLILKDIVDNLLHLNSLYNTRKIIPPYEIDIYYPTLKLAFEYNGKGWHINNNRDFIKHQLFKEKNINIIYINENSRKYEEDIKTQLIYQLNKINQICNTTITKENIINYKVNNVYQTIYNKNDLLNIAKKYSTFKEFKAKEKSVYNKIIKMKLIDEFTTHMKDRRKPHTVDEAKNITSKYINLGDLIKNDNKIYLYIQRNKLHYLTSHLINKNPRKNQT